MVSGKLRQALSNNRPLSQIRMKPMSAKQRKVSASLSYRVATRRDSLSLPIKRSKAAWSKRPWPARRSDPIRRIGGKKGTKRHLPVDERGVPLSIIVGGAHRHDSAKLAERLEAKVIQPEEGQTQNLCLDAGYVGKQVVVTESGYIPHIRPRSEEKEQKAKGPSFKPRRWIVELSHSWFTRLPQGVAAL